MSSDQTTAVDVFFSYSHRDEALRDVLETHLALLKRQGIETWHDRQIGGGRDWEGEIDQHLESADLVLLLISPSFMASDYCFDREMKRALERHEAGEARIVPVILRPTDWQTADFAHLQALPRDGKPITKWRNRDEGFVDVVRGLRKVIAELRQDPAAVATPPRPTYPDDATRKLSEALDAAFRRREALEASDRDTFEVIEEILSLRRRLRQGAQLKAGDYLLDGRFQLLEEIGHGGFAQVWKAYDGQSRVEVAVKVLHGQHTGDRSRRERFFRGARQMAQLAHPHVVPVLEEKCEDGEYCFFVMEYLRGGDFRHAVLENRLSLQERLQIVIEVGEALALAHQRGVIHRDVKPHNILLTLDGLPKLTDFDLVRAADTTGGTRTAMLGTFLYAAPEAMVDARQAAGPADVYGLGMTAIFALHGTDLPSDVLWELPELVAGLEATTSCRQVLLRAVARKLDERWPTAEAFCGALSEAIVPPAAPESPPHTKLQHIHEKDGSVLVYVPGGEFPLGEGAWCHRVVLSSYWIGKYPVTNEQYSRFLKANPTQPKPAFWIYEKFKHSEQPVVGVSWSEALAYCEWAGLNLPSEAQWETAARGPDGRSYPWGNDPPSEELANYDRREGRTTPVGAYPEGAGPYGTLDQAGNVWEWCLDEFEESAYRDRDEQRDPIVKPKGESTDAGSRVARGGSWSHPARVLHVAVRHRYSAGYRSRLLGFRVCWSVPAPMPAPSSALKLGS